MYGKRLEHGKINMILNENIITYEAEAVAVKIGKCAFKAMLEEVYTTPKPGLVDLYSNGAHTDMDVSTFEKSARALYPYFVQIALQGYLYKCTPETLFHMIRKTGIKAEQAMYTATGGVNTHKGLIFTLGIFCAAAGRCICEYGYISKFHLSKMQLEMTLTILTKELDASKGKMPKSNGEKNRHIHGTYGIRGEAILGYPGIWDLALPVLNEGIRLKKDWNMVKLQTLMTLMSRLEDSNIIARTNLKVLDEVQKEASKFLIQGGAYSPKAITKLLKMDSEFVQKNISAGGCADLLAAAIFIEELLSYKW